MQCIRCCSSARKLSVLVHCVTLCIHINPGFPIACRYMPYAACLVSFRRVYEDSWQITSRVSSICDLGISLECMHAFIEEPGYRQSKGIPGWKIYRWKKKHLVLKTMSVAKLLKRLKNRRWRWWLFSLNIVIISLTEWPGLGTQRRGHISAQGHVGY